jgi:hypothetical protein
MEFSNLEKQVESNILNTDMGLIIDMFDGSLEFDKEEDKLEKNKDEQYYIGKAENIIKQLDKDNYFTFLLTMLKKYNILDENQKKIIIKQLDIKPIEKIVEKKIFVKVKNKKKKPKFNNYDDY